MRRESALRMFFKKGLCRGWTQSPQGSFLYGIAIMVIGICNQAAL